MAHHATTPRVIPPTDVIKVGQWSIRIWSKIIGNNAAMFTAIATNKQGNQLTAYGLTPLRRSRRPTPAAQEFARLSPLPWLDFQSDADLHKLIVRDVARLLKHPANRTAPTGTTTLARP